MAPAGFQCGGSPHQPPPTRLLGCSALQDCLALSNCFILCPWGCLAVSLILSSTSFLKTTSASSPNIVPGRRGGGGSQVPEGWAPLHAFVWAAQWPSGRGSVPWGRPHCRPAAGSGKAMWAAGPGQAWAGSVSPRRAGLLEWEGHPRLGGEWITLGLPMAAGLG